MKYHRLGGAFLALACCFSGSAAQQARAGIIPSALARSFDQGPGRSFYRFSYSIQLTSGSTLRPGDYFTIYDFQGLMTDSAVAPNGWTMTAGMRGQTPPGAIAADDPNIENVTFTYGGTASITANNRSVQLGEFSMESYYPGIAMTSFAAEAHRSSDNGLESGSSFIDGPSIVERLNSPEPRTGLLMMLGMSTVLCRKLRRRR
jgi:hypothetical protein